MLRLYTPGLGAEALAALDVDHQAQIPFLENLLREGVPKTHHSELFVEFLKGLGVTPKALTRELAKMEASAEEDEQVFWSLATPVYYQADRDLLRLQSMLNLGGLEEKEAQWLIRDFNHFFAEDKIRLYYVRPELWLLKSPWYCDLPPVETVELADLSDYISHHTPIAFSAWLNEVQMWFHAHPLVQERQQANRPFVNGLWPWACVDVQKAPRQPGLVKISSLVHYLQNQQIDIFWEGKVPSLYWPLTQWAQVVALEHYLTRGHFKQICWSLGDRRVQWPKPPLWHSLLEKIRSVSC